MTLYERLKAVISDSINDIDTHCSDIYVLSTPETEQIVSKYYQDNGLDNMSTHFIDNITHRRFIEIPFGYQEYFEQKENN